MDATTFVNDLQQRIAALIDQTPMADVRAHLKAMLIQQFKSLDLVTREEFDTQTAVLARTRAKLEALEKKVAELELQRKVP